ncbi:hypothetical protein RhiirC2_774928 [Rhizophagus irregularis]|uniref:Uncharacterized protein n=1 Tax=Rhizophagus irregularis TaxID=588596 RepID=A0A2N1NKA8_9GLOM|nr:hypothetical protein RhiirC2_774928 [Rhizophagus irregularis]
MVAISPSGEGWRIDTLKATDLTLSLGEGFMKTGRRCACIEDSKDVLGAGAKGEVISTFIASSETVHERLFGTPAVLVRDKGQSPEGAEESGCGGSRISGLITEGAGGVDIV